MALPLFWPPKFEALVGTSIAHPLPESSDQSHLFSFHSLAFSLGSNTANKVALLLLFSSEVNGEMVLQET